MNDATGEINWFHQDTQGNTRMLTREGDGVMKAAYDYDPYGKETVRLGEVDTPLKYQGQYHDKESGLTYLRARYHDPSTNQFLTVDPLVDITNQPYAYANNDPINYGDPSGLFAEDFQFGSVIVHDTLFGGNLHASRIWPNETQSIANFAGGVLDGITFNNAEWLLPKSAECNFSRGGGWHSLGEFGGGFLGSSGLGAGVGALAKKVGGLLAKRGAAYGTTPAGRPLTRHYVEDGAQERNIPGIVVDRVVSRFPGKSVEGGKTVRFDPVNNVTVVTGDGGSIISARKGPPRRSQM